MNLVDGRLLSAEDCEAVMESLDYRITETLMKQRLDPSVVISACDRLVSGLDEGKYAGTLEALGIDPLLGKKYIDEARRMFSAENLHYRLSMELGADFNKARTRLPQGGTHMVTEEVYPLGVLLHIAAGNADGLPAFSILEGLLTGNINILKLPAEEGGISASLLLELIETEPALADYIYVFDYSSKDLVHMRKLISVADAVVVWGGIDAVAALRQLIPPNIRLIEWGHKISIGYVTELGINQDSLAGLAQNIAETGQLLCSSIQGIYIDTDSMVPVYNFCEKFLPLLEAVVNRSSSGRSVSLQSQVALKLYNEVLEGIFSGAKIYKGKNCSMIAYSDKTLTTSLQFGNIWVKALPRAELVRQLHPYKNFLHTVGLVCGDSQRLSLSEDFFKAGAVRVCPGERMSSAYVGQPHDGEYALRRYTKIVCME